MHGGGHLAVAEEGAVVMGWVPTGEPGGTKLAVTVLVVSEAIVLEQKKLFDCPAARSNVPEATRQEASCWSFRVIPVMLVPLVLVTVIFQKAVHLSWSQGFVPGHVVWLQGLVLGHAFWEQGLLVALPGPPR